MRWSRRRALKHILDLSMEVGAIRHDIEEMGYGIGSVAYSWILWEAIHTTGGDLVGAQTIVEGEMYG